MSAVGGFKKLVPLLNRVLVKKVEPVTKSKSGIIMSIKGDQINIGTIVSTGQGNLTEDGKILPIQVKAGQTVLLPEFGGQKINLEEGEFYLYRDTEILGILEN